MEFPTSWIQVRKNKIPNIYIYILSLLTSNILRVLNNHNTPYRSFYKNWDVTIGFFFFIMCWMDPFPFFFVLFLLFILHIFIIIFLRYFPLISKSGFSIGIKYCSWIVQGRSYPQFNINLLSYMTNLWIFNS